MDKTPQIARLSVWSAKGREILRQEQPGPAAALPSLPPQVARALKRKIAP